MVKDIQNLRKTFEEKIMMNNEGKKLIEDLKIQLEKE